MIYVLYMFFCVVFVDSDSGRRHVGKTAEEYFGVCVFGVGRLGGFDDGCCCGVVVAVLLSPLLWFLSPGVGLFATSGAFCLRAPGRGVLLLVEVLEVSTCCF